MKVIYISYDGMTDPLGQSQVIPYLIGLTKKGHQLTLLSCEKESNFQKGQETIRKLLATNNIEWHPIPYSTSPSMLSKVVNLKNIRRKAIMICKKNKPDIVHCRSYMAALIGIFLKRKFGIKFIFDMRGFWADERIDGGIWNINNFIQRQVYLFFKRKEIEFLKNADYTISLTENAKGEILGWEEFNIKPIPIEIIPCCVDLEHFSPEKIKKGEKDILQKKLNIKPEDFVLSYLGSIGTWYMLDEMLDFFKELISKKTNSKFLFITPDNPENIISLAAQKGISKDKLIIKTATRAEVPIYLSLSNISLYFIKPVFSKKASSPTKTGEIMAMGIPIITNAGIGDSDVLIQKSKSGLMVENFTKEGYLKIIEQLDVLLKLDKQSIREAAFHYFSLEKGVDAYDCVYRELESR